jgi:hypothetical protein
VGTSGPGPRGSTLAQAASLVFALVAVIPLLLFLYSLYTLNALATTRYQIILAVALGVALFGLYILRRMLGHVSALIRDMPRSTPGELAGAAPGGAPSGPRVEGESPRRRQVQVLGIGSVHELAEMNEILDQMWRAEAWRHVGRPVRVLLRGRQGPRAGTLARIEVRGLVLEVGGREDTIDFGQISAIEPGPITPSAP